MFCGRRASMYTVASTLKRVRMAKKYVCAITAMEECRGATRHSLQSSSDQNASIEQLR